MQYKVGWFDNIVDEWLTTRSVILLAMYGDKSELQASVYIVAMSNMAIRDKVILPVGYKQGEGMSETYITTMHNADHTLADGLLMHMYIDISRSVADAKSCKAKVAK